MKTLVPPPLFGDATATPAPIASPVGSGAHKNVSPVGSGASKKAASLFDAAFLCRVYRAMLLFGIPMTLLAGYGLGTLAGAASFVAGMLLAALLLRSQEMAVRSMLRPTSETGGLDAKLLMVMLLPLKFVAVGALLWIAHSLGFLKIAPFGLGFFAGQLVLLCQVAGLLLRRMLARK